MNRPAPNRLHHLVGTPRLRAEALYLAAYLWPDADPALVTDTAHWVVTGGRLSPASTDGPNERTDQ